MTTGPLFGAHLGESVRALIPPWLIPVFYLITFMGNIGFLLVVFAVDYWFGDSTRGAHAIGLAIGGMAVITALKSFFAVPRPPEAVNVIPISGYSFPSGHAVASTIAYGILAFDQEVGTWRVRYAAASLMIVLIALSRVVLGVHFVRDVVAGILVGLIFLAGAILLTRHAPRPGFLLALLLGTVAFAISGASRDGVAVLGAAVGGAVAWELLDRTTSVESLRARAVLVGGALPVFAAAGYVSTLSGVHLVVVFVLNVGIMAGILTSPLLVRRYGPG